jgi:hypothetical protein
LPWEVVGVFYSRIGVPALCDPPKDAKPFIFMNVRFSFTVPEFFTTISASERFGMRQHMMMALIFIKVRVFVHPVGVSYSFRKPVVPPGS